jgi:transcriptional regulator with XRE-family HTH domain
MTAKKKNNRTTVVETTTTAEERPFLARLAARLSRLRTESGITQNQLAAASGVSESYIKIIEGGTENPSAGKLWLLCKGYQITIGKLFEPWLKESPLVFTEEEELLVDQARVLLRSKFKEAIQFNIQAMYEKNEREERRQARQ